MRVTIIVPDSYVAVNGVGFLNIDMSSIPPGVHAMQWYDTWGEVEFVDAPSPTEEDPNRVIKPENQIINDLAQYQTVIDLWQTQKNAQS